ncbi:hypothetical protein cyc_06562 [Cyclospora cayetanensis]|uniref:Uncharacterized protein n=1 Tax=Cyclospora cayetanensis TaxID=88456 RepID=A0A1D3D3E7_9EIME|nr:hypothetical protein cyc_06562 [Cyclospora cayetanensis]
MDRAAAEVDAWRRSSAPSPAQNPIGYLNLERFVTFCIHQQRQQQHQMKQAACTFLCHTVSRAAKRRDSELLRQSLISWRCRMIAEEAEAATIVAATASPDPVGDVALQVKRQHVPSGPSDGSCYKNNKRDSGIGSSDLKPGAGSVLECRESPDMPGLATASTPAVPKVELAKRYGSSRGGPGSSVTRSFGFGYEALESSSRQ